MSSMALLTGLAAAVAVLLSTGSGRSAARVGPPRSAAGSSQGVSAMVAFGAVLGVPMVVGILLGSPLLTVGAPVMGSIGWIGIAGQAKARTARRQLAMAPVVVELIAQRLRAGSTALTALVTLEKEQAQAVGVHSVVAEVNAGASLACALTGTSEPGGLLRAALLAVEMSGGAGAAAVERLADRMRLGAGAEATARAQSGQQLASASLMAALPPVIALLYALSDRRAAEFYTKSLAGALLVVSAMALSGLSWLWMRWILQSRSLR